MRLTPADMLTLSRLVLTPVFLALFLVGQTGWAIVVFCVAGLTDLVDGTVARLCGHPSKAGAILDPLADKALVQTCFIALAVVRVLPLWFVLLAAARDVMILGGILYLSRIQAKLPFKAAVVSKIATFFMLAVAVSGLLMRYDPSLFFLGRSIQWWVAYSVIATAALLIVSGIRYVMIGFEIVRRRSASRA